MEKIKVWLDDNCFDHTTDRFTPEGWTGVMTPEEAIALLSVGNVSHISLDNDLGLGCHREGRHVLDWMEAMVHTSDLLPRCIIYIHTGNVQARDVMLVVRKRIYDKWDARDWYDFNPTDVKDNP